MQIVYIPLDRLSVSKANMRVGRKPPDVSDILPSIIKRGVVSPLFVRPDPAPNSADEWCAGHFEIIAGKRRYYASLEAAKQGKDDISLPCITLGEGDDAEALEISMIENMLRQNPDPVTQWESYTRLVKQGRSVEDISATFALSELQVKRILALGNLLPRIREAYRAEEIDAATVRHLTLATKAQQKAWLALFRDADSHAPRGQQLKAWLFGGASISVSMALFDIDAFSGQIVTNLFEEDGYFADADQFWAAQSAVIEQRKAEYLAAGWSDVQIIPPHEHFSSWEYEKTPKRKGGRIYIECRASGEVVFHEGYLTRKEAQRIGKGDGDTGAGVTKPARPELTAALTAYVDLHRHAAVRTELASRPHIALCVMVAHAICGSPLWSVKVQEQHSRNDAVNESIETCLGETRFDERRRAVLDVLGFDPDRISVTHQGYGSANLVAVVTRLLELPENVVLDVAAVVMAETLASGSALIEMLGVTLGVSMADYWQPDQAFYDLLRDKEVATAILAEVGGSSVAEANAKETGKVIKSVIADCLNGENGRKKQEAWVPRWMAFPPSAYTARGGVATVTAANRAASIAEIETADQPDPAMPVVAAEAEIAADAQSEPRESAEAEEEQLAA
ncbi:MAG: ParB N-terminal domain-containing protein [Roseovarius sp.]|uniref:ParB/RepB/Spo0J family partition protein n=1 Tax=Roseovarius sp. TaxID=1486281 RepID=UPI001B59E407|nr:ParB N-terminal domain-containing protein [Roseovarius sp.]MBQ0750376.1 ParB N-terminal domain-containing protein [Roseovarius sp.]|tara:strand:- start:12509 stop:14374 length:1866 start_codon:yes stop_codon:yes gene_type:complete